MKRMTNKNLYKSHPVIFAGAVLMLVVQSALAGQTFTVTNTNDTGRGSLRQAIEYANSDAGEDVIAFNITARGRLPNMGKHTIQPLTPLPHITDPVIIDGYTQPGAAPATDDTPATLLIELDGIKAGVGSVSGLIIAAGNSTVRGLVINRFGDVGIHIQENGGNIIEGNYIGTDVTGTVDRGNSDDGIRIWDAPGNRVGGATAEARNIISGNNDMGVEIIMSGATGNTVQGNYIGTDVTGTADLGNSTHGVFIGASSNTIGDLSPGTGNVISGNGGTGIEINGFGVTGNQILGNFIGTDASRREVLGNTSAGVRIISCRDNTLTDNTVSNNGYGIQLQSSSDNQIYNNNFIDNTIQAYFTGRGGNIFNLEKPIGGNYWNDWTNPDADSDGFVDDPYVFTGGVDYLPWARQDGWLLTPNVYYVDAVNGDDNNDGFTPQTALATIQMGIDATVDGEVVLVYPGLYQEEINFTGKSITVQGVVASPASAPVLQNPGDFAVSFYSGEGRDSILKNFIISDSFMGVFIAGSSPTISNITIVNNKYGIEAYIDSEPDISNCIVWNNSDGDLFECRGRYSCIERGGEGEGNIDADPLFVNPDSGDYHLLSERGRYWPEYDIWVLDKVTSPCIDGGAPNSDYSNEPTPNGGRINMGAYGGTSEASLSPSGQPSPPPSKALNPSPADGAIDVNRDVTLNWNPGRNAVSHDVYLGTDGDAVANADTTNTTGIYRGRQSATSYTPPDGLGWSSRYYYWRIDEVDSEGNKTIGDVWTFTAIIPPPKGRACFPADTSVWVNGELVQISNVVSGQMAGELHCGPATDCLEQIETVEEHEGTFECRDIVLESGNRISVVDAHCFMLDSGQWIAAQNLRSGLRLKTLSGTVSIKSVATRTVPFVGKVYNLKVKSSDRYIVGKDGVIVRDY